MAPLVEATIVSSPGTDQLAAARMLVQLSREDLAEPMTPGLPTGSLGPPWPIQPDHPGQPHGSPPALWLPSALAAASVVKPWLKNEAGESFDAIRTWRIRDPVPLASRGRWQVWELRFRFRLGGGLVAVYDRRSNRHRWIWGTEYDNGFFGRFELSHFDILLLEGDLLLLRNRFEGRAFLWAADLARGVVRQVGAGDNATFRRVAQGIAVSSDAEPTRVLPLSALRP
jgi:hypothetical protein